jgi:Zn finger protein HypA/HybF involved in hydrogenase expression
MGYMEQKIYRSKPGEGNDFDAVTTVFDVLVEKKIDYTYSAEEITKRRFINELFKKHHIHLTGSNMTITVAIWRTIPKNDYQIKLIVGPVTERNQPTFDELAEPLKETFKEKFNHEDPDMIICPECGRNQMIPHKVRPLRFICKQCEHEIYLKKVSRKKFYRCPHCKQPLKFPIITTTLLYLKCPHCGKISHAPERDELISEEESDEITEILCPKCDKKQEIPSDKRPLRFKCEQCKYEINLRKSKSKNIIRCPDCKIPLNIPPLPTRPLEFKCYKCKAVITIKEKEETSTDFKSDKYDKIQCPKCETIQEVPTNKRPIEFGCVDCGQKMIMKKLKIDKSKGFKLVKVKCPECDKLQLLPKWNKPVAFKCKDCGTKLVN